jgi:hypothetical protein
LRVGTILGTLPIRRTQPQANKRHYSNETERVAWYAREDSNL